MRRAAYKILANDKDITTAIEDRLIRLTLHDESGIESDTVEIELDNRDQVIAFPATGAELEISIGYEGEPLVFRGVFTVDELEEPLELAQLIIKGKAAKMKKSLKAPRDISYNQTTLGKIAQSIADFQEYELAISSELAAITIQHVDQIGESDLNLLTRLAREHGAVFKIIANRLLIIPKGQSRTAAGKGIPEFTFSDPENSSGRVTITERSDYQCVEAFWFDEATQQKQAVTAGAGEPKFTIRRTFKEAERAKQAAQAKLEELQRGCGTLALTRPLEPRLVAEAMVTLSNHKASANGRWLVESISQVIRAGGVGTTSAQCSIPKR